MKGSPFSDVKEGAPQEGFHCRGFAIGIRPQFRLLEKKIVRTETDMARFDWLLLTYK